MEDGEPWVNPAHRAPDPLAVPQATSLLGEELFALEDTTGAVAAADSALAEAPDDLELLLPNHRSCGPRSVVNSRGNRWRRSNSFCSSPWRS
jgi:hypothetical protein